MIGHRLARSLRRGKRPRQVPLFPDAQAFLDAMRTARTVKADADHANGVRPWNSPDPDAWYDRKVAIRHEYAVASQRAWNALRESRHPVLAWIANNTEPYVLETEAVLRALTPTTTLDELDALADDHGWCGAWFRLRTQAIGDGVVSYDRPVGPVPDEPADTEPIEDTLGDNPANKED